MLQVSRDVPSLRGVQVDLPHARELEWLMSLGGVGSGGSCSSGGSGGIKDLSNTQRPTARTGSERAMPSGDKRSGASGMSPLPLLHEGGVCVRGCGFEWMGVC